MDYTFLLVIIKNPMYNESKYTMNGGYTYMDVIIQRTPRSSIKCNTVDIEELQDFEWSYQSGGYQESTADPYLYAKILYTRAMELVDCSGEHNFGDNLAKVLIPKGKNKKEYKEGYNECANRAGEKPASYVSKTRPKGYPPCTKYILEILEKQPDKQMQRLELRKEVIGEYPEEKYPEKTYYSAIKALKKQGKITVPCEHYTKQIISINMRNSSDKDHL